MLLDLAENALGARPGLVVNLPLYQDLQTCDIEEKSNLLQLRTVCYAKSTWVNVASSIKPYLSFCEVRGKNPYPVDRTVLELCILKLIQDGKSRSVIENLVKSLIFASNFLGCHISLEEKVIKNALKFASKICNIPRIGL